MVCSPSVERKESPPFTKKITFRGERVLVTLRLGRVAEGEWLVGIGVQLEWRNSF